MDRLIYKEISLDPDTKDCFLKETKLNLPKHEFLLLQFLIEHQGRIFSRQELVTNVWESKVTLRTVDVTISRLRRKLGGDYIVTKSGFGYGII